MKKIDKILLFLIAILLLSIALEPQKQKQGYINMQVLAKIESSKNPLAYNKRTGARGLFQITKPCLLEFNEYNHKNYTLNQLYNPSINYEVAFWYINTRIPQMLKYYQKEVTIRNILICYNAGISYVVENKELKKETKNYLKKYFNLIK